jgi:predicted nucleic acid-binding protein
MTAVVVDASIALALVLPDEKSAAAEKLLREAAEEDLELLTTGHWQLEIANGLHQAYRRKRIAAGDRLDCLAALTRLPIRIVDHEPERELLFSLADRSDLSIYDAAYLALAIDEGALLATGDAALARAANKNGAEWK